MILKQFTGVSIPKLENFLGIEEEEAEEVTVEGVKREFVEHGFVIEG